MSFQQGISGLSANSKYLDVIGNNIANSSTVGAKSSRVEFADVYSSAQSSGANKQTGGGVSVAAVSQNFGQGGITSTGNPLDLAISGKGFFQMKGQDGTVHYTRDGQFKLNSNGEIVNNQDHLLMGYPADAAGAVLSGQAQAVQLKATSIEPKATTAVIVNANLDSRSVAIHPAGGPAVVFTDPSTYNNATAVNAVDANGKDVVLTSYFQKTSADTWDVYMTANGAAIGGTPTVPVTTITFDPTGSAPLSPTTPVTVNVPAGPVVNGVGTLPITGLLIDMSTFTQFASPYGVTKLAQDGYSAGALIGMVVDSSGLVRANYSNGRTKSIGQIEMATFTNLNGLQPLGGGEWASTINSGGPALGVPGSGNLGTLQTSALEESNVDLTGELVNLITAQRLYQANAKTISTQDQVLQTLVNLQ